MIPVIEKDTLSLTFRAPWALEDHAFFIRSKALPEAEILFDAEADAYTVRAPARFAPLMGLAAPEMARARLPVPERMRADQRWVLDLALRAKRFAAWTDCGWGKTFLELEFARQVHAITGGRVLIFAPPSVVPQTVNEEAPKFYPQGGMRLHRIGSRAELRAWAKGDFDAGTPFAIVNYEKMIAREDGEADVIPELRWLAGVVLDESSLLKSGGGVIKWALIKSCRGIEYKLSCTATPAPNDTMEYASQASFLEKLRSEGEILWTYFARDPKTQTWKVKAHAREAFYRFMAGWSIYLRKPGLYGFDDPFSDVPEPLITEHRVTMTAAQACARVRLLGAAHAAADGESDLIIEDRKLGIAERGKLSQLAKGFRYHDGGQVLRVDSLKPAFVAELVRKHVAAGRQVLVWCIFDEEARVIERLLRGEAKVEGLHGSTSDDDRGEILERFRRGATRVLVSKARLLGYGMNFQFCEAMVFSGFDDSFEAFYQAVRRCYRYGSRNRLHVEVPYVPELENHVWANVLRKRDQWEGDTAECERCYAAALRAA
jgi:hypothetical protein